MPLIATENYDDGERRGVSPPVLHVSAVLQVETPDYTLAQNFQLSQT